MIERIERLDRRINAVVVRDFERARDAARAADTALSRGEAGALLGIPISVKESFNVAGLPTTWGDPRFRHFMPKEDALVVSRVKKAGAVIFGKTNVPRWLSDWQSYDDLYGTTRNPFDLRLTPGDPRQLGGSARSWFRVAVTWVGHRCIPACTGALLRRLCAHAELGPGAAPRAGAAGNRTAAAGDRSCRRRPDGPLRRGSETSARRDRRSGRGGFGDRLPPRLSSATP